MSMGGFHCVQKATSLMEKTGGGTEENQAGRVQGFIHLLLFIWQSFGSFRVLTCRILDFGD